MSQSQIEGNAVDNGASLSSSLETGSSSGGGGDEQAGGLDLVIKNDSGAVECSPVFTNKLIIEKLVLYSIHDSRGNILPKMVGAVRAVQKSWLEVTTSVLRKLEDPVITLEQSKLPSRTNGLSQGGLKTLQKFTEVFSDPARLQRSSLPFPYKLCMDHETFLNENYKIVLNCLSSTGADLVELDINYPSHAAGIPPLKFPFLQKLTFNFARILIANYNPVCSLQCILDGCHGLTKLAIGQDHNDIVVQEGIEFLRLPDTLVSLEVKLRLESQELEALVFQLTKLEHLKLTLHHRITYPDGLLFRILDKFRKTLKKFYVIGSGLGRLDGTLRRTYLQFPVMEKLEALEIISTECELGLGPWCDSGIEQFVPKLNGLALYGLTEAMFAKWLDNYESDKIKRMGISIINEQLQLHDENFVVSIKTEMLAQVKAGFPNLTHLSLGLNIVDMNALKYLFRNMMQLTGLELFLSGEIGNDGRSRSKVDSIMLGLPFEVLRALEFLQNYEVKGEQEPGLVNLTELKVLGLWTVNWNTGIPEDQRISLISDNFFNYALLKMPKLCELKLYGRFKPSDDMKQKWTEQEGRLIKYAPYLDY